jgi:HEAT repeat protein
MESYAKGKPSLDALPLLKTALNDPYKGVVRMAAHAIKKIGSPAYSVIPDLIDAAKHAEERNPVPQAFAHCLAAIVAIDPESPEIIPLIDGSGRHSNWYLIRSSLEALAAIETSEAAALFASIDEQFSYLFSKQQRTIVDKLREQLRA